MKNTNILTYGTSLYCPQPIINTIAPIKINQSTTIDVTITGYNFTPTTTVTIPNVTVNSVTVDNPTQITVNVTSSASDSVDNITVTSECGTAVYNNFEVELSTWNLYSTGNTYTIGTTAGNDIRLLSGMTAVQTATGMRFTGSNPWSSWAKLEYLGWTRGDNKTCQIIVSAPTSFMMFGISSDQTNEAATDQYRQGEVHSYLQNNSTHWGLYGNNGTPGGTGNQANSVSITGYSYIKAKFEGDGSTGSTYTLYGLNNTSNLDDESNVLTTLTVGGSLNPQQTNIFPVILPRADTQELIATKIT